MAGSNQTIRQYRDYYIAQSDWTQTIDSPLSDSKKAEWQSYRQALRDIPANFPDAVSHDYITWPTQPS
jgi:hypothetical protein|tara:strand:+ start:2774 stop:2977 length:204 start_codon:yes stop_codon:yes gene_type:complete